MTLLRDDNTALSLVEFQTLLIEEPGKWNPEFLEQSRFDLPRMQSALTWTILPDAVTVYPDEQGLLCYDW